MTAEEDYLEPGTRVRRRYGAPDRRGEVAWKVGYVDNDTGVVHLSWRLVRWDSGKSTIFRAIDLIEIEGSNE